jgi:hypothetical protein
MSTLLQRFAANQARRTLMNPTESSCPGACHQPTGNAAAQDEIRDFAPESSWLDGLDASAAAHEKGPNRALFATLDTGRLEDGGFGVKAEAALASGREELLASGCHLEGALGKVAYEGSTKAQTASASALEIALDCRGPDADVADFLQGRFGLGAGQGVGMRSSVTDADRDGRQECNYGVDIGPFTADTTSEVLCPANVLPMPWWAQ